MSNYSFQIYSIQMSSSEDENAENSRARALTKLIIECTGKFTETIRACKEDYPTFSNLEKQLTDRAFDLVESSFGQIEKNLSASRFPLAWLLHTGHMHLVLLYEQTIANA